MIIIAAMAVKCLDFAKCTAKLVFLSFTFDFLPEEIMFFIYAINMFSQFYYCVWINPSIWYGFWTHDLTLRVTGYMGPDCYFCSWNRKPWIKILSGKLWFRFCVHDGWRHGDFWAYVVVSNSRQHFHDVGSLLWYK